jgi:Tfp pilus assembly protein PilV
MIIMRTRTSGSALILALIFSMVVGAAGAAAYRILQVRSRQAYQNASWQEALLAAEGGVDLAVNALRSSIHDPNAWAMWHGNTSEILDGEQTAIDSVMGTVPSASKTFLLSDKLIRASTLGGARSWCEVSIDAPKELRDAQGTQWFRVRSLGVAEVPGAAVVAGDRADLSLRKFDLRTNRRTGNRVITPQATRMIEVIIKPVGAFRLALLAEKTINMNSRNITVDSYDSRDASKSNYDPLHPEIYGRYNVAERQSNGSIVLGASPILYTCRWTTWRGGR